MTSLADVWSNYNESHGLHRVLEDAKYYERHLPPRSGTSQLRLLEIGIQSGGSARCWKTWYGERLYYAGVDVEPACRRTESIRENMFVDIGSQYNASFLQEVCRKHGPFDVVIDDGAHRPEAIRASLHALFPASARCMRTPSLYVIEDMHTMVMSKYQKRLNDPSDMLAIVGEAFWSMHAAYYDVVGWRKHAYGVNQTTVGVTPLHPPHALTL